MNDGVRTGMAEVMRLMRAGQLGEATSTIQRALGGASSIDPAVTEPGGSPPAAGGTRRVVDSIPPQWETALRGMLEGGGASAGTALPAVSGLPAGLRRAPGAAWSPAPEMAPSSTRAGGRFVDGTYAAAAGRRDYKLYIPAGYTGQAVPLVVMLHGCTQTPLDFAAGTGMNALAEKEVFLVVYPAQAQGANSSKCWNWFQAADQQRGMGEPSLIAGITQQVSAAYSVDVGRVYVAGLSSGGAMAAVMAATYPDLYAAVAVHSGLPYASAHDLPSALKAMRRGASKHAHTLARVIPLIVFHGDRDATVAAANADRILEQWTQAAEAADNAPGGRRGPMRDVAVQRGQARGGHTFTRSVYCDAAGHVGAEKWLIHEAGHAWSGGSPAGSYTDPGGPDASAEMVRFFNEHPMGA